MVGHVSELVAPLPDHPGHCLDVLPSLDKINPGFVTSSAPLPAGQPYEAALEPQVSDQEGSAVIVYNRT